MKINQELILRQGFVEFESDCHTQSSITIANIIGTIDKYPSISDIQILRPSRAENNEKSSYSGQFGMGDFPLHTDMAHWWLPPRYILLRCIQESSMVETRIIKASEIFNDVNEELMNRAIFRPRRRLNGRLSILRLKEEWGSRWDSTFLKPISKSALTVEAVVEARISKVTPNSILLNSPRACVLIDNWHALHGRSAVPLSAKNRILERVYLSDLKG